MEVKNVPYPISGPFYVWEPQSSHCSAENLGAHVVACADVTVFSPTSTDLEMMLSGAWAHNPTINVQINILRFVDLLGKVNGVNKLKYIIVRCGTSGVFVFDFQNNARWYRFREPRTMRPNVLGYEHAFLGAFVMKLKEKKPLHEMVNSGLAAADIVLNHWGMPYYTKSSLLSDETWNDRTLRECSPKRRGGWLPEGEVESNKRRRWNNFKDFVSDWFD